jgi:hypothetical protein
METRTFRGNRETVKAEVEDWIDLYVNIYHEVEVTSVDVEADKTTIHYKDLSNTNTLKLRL